MRRSACVPSRAFAWCLTYQLSQSSPTAIGDDLTAFRLSIPLTLAYLRKKIDRMADKATFERFPALMRALARDGLGTLTSDGDGGTDVAMKDAQEGSDEAAVKSEDQVDALRAGA